MSVMIAPREIESSHLTSTCLTRDSAAIAVQSRFSGEVVQARATIAIYAAHRLAFLHLPVHSRQRSRSFQ